MSSKKIDLDLWLDKTVIDRQKQLKTQFIEILEEIGNSLSNEELTTLHPSSKGKKVSKGNDLLGYPYIVLDVIRDFNPLSGMNIRILNWFGHGFFLLVFLGKETEGLTESMLDNGFEFGLTDNPWDFGKLILQKETSRTMDDLIKCRDRFQIWIKQVNHFSEINLLKNEILKEVKNVIHLTLNSSLK